MADTRDNKLQVGGFAGWAIAAVQRSREKAAARRYERSLEVLETISLGGKRQVALIACGEQKFLVGLGAESVDSIVPVKTPEERSPIVVNAGWGAGF